VAAKRSMAGVAMTARVQDNVNSGGMMMAATNNLCVMMVVVLLSGAAICYDDSEMTAPLVITAHGALGDW